jgi:UDP-4-amino-4,6-dideoxy-N-acetyl-beta-L-altrosamine transaminase
VIPYGRQEVTEADIEAVVAVLRSDFLTQGPAVGEFEAAVCRLTGAPHAVASSNGTAALHLACAALQLGRGDHLWTTPISFVASANCGLYCGAAVSFVDVDPHTGLLCVAALREKLREAERTGTLPRVLVVVHLAGHVADMAAIAAETAPYGVHIIEDASHAIGAARDGATTGACDHSVITVFSFHPVKVVTAAEGGVATTRDPALASRMALLRTHGITRDAVALEFEKPGDWYYEQQCLGFNYRLSDLHAALGCSQLARLDDYIDRRAALAKRYREALEGVALVDPEPGVRSAWHLAMVHTGSAGRRARLFAMLREAGFGANVHYLPIHLQPYYRRLGFRPGDYPGAEAFYVDVISLPLYPTLDADAQEAVIALLNRDALQRSVAP